MLTVKAFAACVLLAANTYDVPPAVMIGIMNVEGGRIGQEVGPNTNGTYDLGPMQVNTLWLPTLQKTWKVNEETAREWVRDNGCVNVHVAAWILRQKMNSTKNLWEAIAAYHSQTPSKGIPYAKKVISVMDRKGLVKRDEALYSAPKNAQE